MSAILAHLDFLDEQIQLLSDEIEAQLAPFAGAVELLCTIPGVQRRTAEAVLAEIGTDMRRFPSERHLASWAGQCPGNDVKHSILCACWHMLTTGELYRELGGDYYSRRDPERSTRRLVAQLERLGHRVTLEAAAA